MNRMKRRYGQVFGLPEEQVKFFDELTEEQVEEVRYHFTANLIYAELYAYAVKKDGHLVRTRERRKPEWELTEMLEQLATKGVEK